MNRRGIEAWLPEGDGLYHGSARSWMGVERKMWSPGWLGRQGAQANSRIERVRTWLGYFIYRQVVYRLLRGHA